MLGRLAIPLSLALAAGCVRSYAELKPAMRERGSAYYYELERGGRNWGDAKVWSAGSYEVDRDGAVVRLQLRIRNDADRPLTVDLAECRVELLVDDDYRTVRQEERPEPSVVVKKDETRRIGMTYPLPADVDPEDIEEVEFNWVVAGPGGRITKSSLFVPVVERRRVTYRPTFFWGYGHPHDDLHSPRDGSGAHPRRPFP